MNQAVVWSKKKSKLSREDQAYKFNQILMYGSLEEIKDLINKEGLDRVKEVFVNQPTKIYTKPAFNLIKNFILKIRKDLDQSKYIKTMSPSAENPASDGDTRFLRARRQLWLNR